MGKNKAAKANGHINDELKLEKPKASAGGSSLSLWIVILIITVGTAGGLHFIIEQVGSNNAALTKKIQAFKEELSSFKEFQAQSANIGDKLDLLNSIQEEIAAFKTQTSADISAVAGKMTDSVAVMETSIAEVQQKVTTSVDDVTATLNVAMAKVNDDVTSVRGAIGAIETQSAATTDKLLAIETNTEVMVGRTAAQISGLGEKLAAIEESTANVAKQVAASGEHAATEIAAVTAQVKDVVGSLDGIAQKQASTAAEAVKADVTAEISAVSAELSGVKAAAVQSSKDVSTLVKELAGLADSMAPSSALKSTESEVSALKALLAEVSGSVSSLKKELAAAIEKMDQQTYSLGGHLKLAKEEILEVKEMVGPLNDVIMSIQNIKRSPAATPVAAEEPAAVEPEPEVAAEPEAAEPEVAEPEEVEPEAAEEVVEAEPEVVAEPEVAEPAAEEAVEEAEPEVVEEVAEPEPVEEEPAADE